MRFLDWFFMPTNRGNGLCESSQATPHPPLSSTLIRPSFRRYLQLFLHADPRVHSFSVPAASNSHPVGPSLFSTILLFNAQPFLAVYCNSPSMHIQQLWQYAQPPQYCWLPVCFLTNSEAISLQGMGPRQRLAMYFQDLVQCLEPSKNPITASCRLDACLAFPPICLY